LQNHEPIGQRTARQVTRVLALALQRATLLRIA